MREIKFRAYVTNLDEICEVSEIYSDINEIAVIDSEGQYFRVNSMNYELMQYTGLKTKSEKEVYEGDVLSLQAHQDHYVDFYSCGFVGKSTNKVQRINWMPVPLWKLIEMDYEVTGNIYDNPIKE